ncbi:NADPH:quinone reductase-like Zn-dependent oxidoreductase [Duganella sp. 1411]|uniref:NADP-dependent oxidoreductase n=1 Tax=Duganella sp. 1411 TaxID=2806572 RepID=UPI001AE2B2A3|nr:NADP-dependent oxidoreductase [Duganella sp. 1411]MBP1206917.1 NADPH:quinone reductase-like Zn-dependent oxidoreductase [Duganella sp. 1411]
MKALVLKRYNKAGKLEFAEIARPIVGSDEMLVQVRAAGLNPIDNMIPTGAFKPLLKFELPAVMGNDLAGVVVQVGNRVSRFKVGDAVYATLFDLGRGSLAEYAVVPESAAALKPANLDFVQAAAMPMVALTVWQALKERMRLKPGQKLFVPAGSGGIGTMAIQLAKQFGATVGTTTSTANVELVRGLGADEVVDYKRQNFEETMKDYDAVLGTVRGDGLEKALRIVRPGSTVVSLIGPPDAAFARGRGMNFFMRFVFGLLSRKIIGLARGRGAGYAFMFVRPDGAQLAEIGKLLENGSVRPVIDKVFPFTEAVEALAYLAQGRAKGKVVVRMVRD